MPELIPRRHQQVHSKAIFRVSNAPMDFSGFETLSSLNHASSENRHFAHKFHFFHQVSASFISIDIRFHISPGLFSLNKWPLLTLTGPPFHCSCRTRLNLSMLLLLIIGGVKVNPGLSSSPNLTFGMLNTRSVVNKAPLLHSLITDNDLSILAIAETWVKSDDPPVIINGPAPPGYGILHVHRDNPDQNRGGGLAIIHRDTINIQPRKHKINHSSFELQLVNITLQSRDILLANIYRPPSSSKSLFFEEFGLLLTNLRTEVVDRLIICGDFNLPGTSPDTIDNGLAELLHSTSFTQFVKSPTRHDSHHDRSSLLDLTITPSSSKLVTMTSVVSSHEISDHDLTLTNLNTKRYKSPQRTYHYRNIKSIDLELFEQTILSSSLFSSPDSTVDGYANQMETELTSILDKVAPLKTGHRIGPRKAKNWLSPEAVDAKKQRRRLERQWKASNAEPDRLVYRAACSSANKLITTSFATSNLECINEASKNPKRLWTTIKSILHSSPPNEQLSPPISQSLANSLASFFYQKIVFLKDSIALKLQGSPTPFDFDLPHSGEVFSDFTPVTPAEVSQLLRSMSNKSSPLDYIPMSLLKSCADTFSILISHLANLFFTQATFSSKFKLALISPRC